MSDIRLADLVGEETAREAAELFPEMTEDQMVAMYFVNEACEATAEMTGLTPLEVYDLMYDGKAYTVNVKTGEDGELNVKIEFDHETGE